jgi:hypothetical protein
VTEESRQSQFHSELSGIVAKSNRKLLISLICAAIACSTITVLGVQNGEGTLYSNVLAVVASGSAFVLSLQVIYRQKTKGLFPRLYASLGLALALWFTAEVIWAYYEVVVGIETPFPSLADAFWLAGYIPFFYFLVGILKHFLGMSKSMLFPLLAMSSIGFVLLGNILLSLYQSADLTSQEGIISYVIGSAYPVADMFLIVPAAVVFFQLRKGKLTFTPWAFIVIATIVFIIGDIGFAYSTSIAEMADMVWVWYPLYNLGDIAIASSLFWHKSFFTIDEKKLIKAWQEKNR